MDAGLARARVLLREDLGDDLVREADLAPELLGGQSSDLRFLFPPYCGRGIGERRLHALKDRSPRGGPGAYTPRAPPAEHGGVLAKHGLQLSNHLRRAVGRQHPCGGVIIIITEQAPLSMRTVVVGLSESSPRVDGGIELDDVLLKWTAGVGVLLGLVFWISK